ncbi:MAG: M4 family metallopeptidase [Chitinophagaceae bacterium]
MTAISAKKESLVNDLIANQDGVSFAKTTSTIQLKNGESIQQEKYLLYKNKIRLRGGEYTINIANDTDGFVNGFFAPISSEGFEESYNMETCMKLAIEQFNESHQVKKASEISMGIVDTAYAVYYYDYVQQQYRPAYQVQIRSKDGAYSENVFISAATGKFLGSENRVCTINFTGTAQTRYSGTRSIVTDATTGAGPFRLQETRGANNVLIRTRNMNHQTGLTNVTEFSDNDNTWTAAEHGTDQAALDAHWGAETVLDYWLNVHSRNSINGSGMAIESYVHLGTNVFNAYWSENAMKYGDGLGGTNPLTSLDICAHEFGHGIDQFTGDLLYEKESGALDEGFADIWGACIEAWAKSTGSPWLMGEEVSGGPLRDMANPNAFSQPDTYLGTYWVSQTGCSPNYGNDYCGVHKNSGVLNFWFYLLSEGGTGTNDIGNAYNVSGVGINTAADIAYATKQLAGGTTDYATCRSLSIQAATTLFGANSCQTIAVTNAWYAVGVGAAYSGNGGFSISGSTTVCTSATYSIPNLPTGATVTWSASPSGYVTLSPSGNSVTVAKTTNGTVTLTATVTTACASFGISKTLYVGVLNASLVSVGGDNNIVPNQPGNYVSFYNGIKVCGNMTPAGITSVNWSSSPSGTGMGGSMACDGDFVPTNGGYRFSWPSTGTKYVYASVTNACGSSGNSAAYVVYVNTSGSGYYLLSPNPVSSASDINIAPVSNSLSAKSADGAAVSAVTRASLYEMTGSLKKEVRYAPNTYTGKLRLPNLAPGSYFVVLDLKDGTQERHTVIVK